VTDNEMARFPCECPRCSTSAGYPYRVQTDATAAQRVRIDLRCRGCRHEWRVERTAPALSSRDLQAANGTASTLQQPPPTAIAADGPDFLDPALTWTPTRRFGHGQVYEYRLTLDGNDVAILQLVPGRGWAMSIAHGTGQPDSDRGLFATPRDALMLLLAEFGVIEHDADTEVEARGEAQATGT
jgi:hypothetical protein